MSIDMNQTIAEASLDNLHDIIIPDAAGLFPLAPGWVMVLLLVLALLFHFILQGYKHYKKSQYRREALQELVIYAKESKGNTVALLSLAKRVGIAAYGRKEVAKLSANNWWDFMEEHSKVKVNSGLRQEIEKLLYNEAYELSDALHSEVRESVVTWIKTHRRDGDV